MSLEFALRVPWRGLVDIRMPVDEDNWETCLRYVQDHIAKLLASQDEHCSCAELRYIAAHHRTRMQRVIAQTGITECAFLRFACMPTVLFRLDERDLVEEFLQNPLAPCSQVAPANHARFLAWLLETQAWPQETPTPDRPTIATLPPRLLREESLPTRALVLTTCDLCCQDLQLEDAIELGCGHLIHNDPAPCLVQPWWDARQRMTCDACAA